MFPNPFGGGGVAAGYTSKLLKTGQTTQYNSELDDGYYEKGVEKAYSINTTGAQSGTTNVDLAHLVNTGISFDAASKEIRCTGQCGVFKAGGGETIVVSGTASNNGVFTTVSADANKVVVVEALTNESAGASMTIAKREAMSNNTVLDLNTGLEWMRYQSVKMGIAGEGKMPWTGKIYDIFQWAAACNAFNIGGFSDWRVPNIYETYGLLGFGTNPPVPYSTAFPTFANGNTYSSTAFVENPGAFALGLIKTYGYSNVGYIDKTVNTFCMFLVRGG